MKELTARVAIDRIRRQRKELDAAKAELALTTKQRDDAHEAFMEERNRRKILKDIVRVVKRHRKLLLDELGSKDEEI